MTKDKTNRPLNIFSPTPAPTSTQNKSTDTDEVSKVTNLNDMFRKAEKMERMLMRMVAPISRIPDVELKVDDTIERVTRVEEKIEGQKDRVTELDKKITKSARKAHDCFQVGVITDLKDIQRETAQSVEVANRQNLIQETKLEAIEKSTSQVEGDIEEIRKAPRNLLFGLLGILLTIITGAGGAVWFLAELSKDVEFEKTQRSEQIERIETSIKGLAKTADPQPVIRQVKILEERVERSSDSEEVYNGLCDGMTVPERRAVVRVLNRREKPIPVSCIE